MVRRSVALVLLCIGVLYAVPAAASADTGEIIEPQGNPPTNADGWQAGTCLTDEPVTGEPNVHCGPSTGGAFFKQAGGHPPVGFTQYTIQHEPVEPSGLPSPPFPETFKAAIAEPEVNKTIKTLRVDLPPGLTVNPNATSSKCDTKTEFLNSPAAGVFVPTCSAATRVGTEEVTVVTNRNGIELELAPNTKVAVPKGFIVPPGESTGTKVPVYNLTPNEGEPALFGFVVAGKEPVFLHTEVAWQSDFHESFTIELPNTASEPGLSTLISRLINNGASAGNGSYINNPTTCFNPAEPAYEHLYSTWFRAESYGVPNPTFPNGSTPIESKVVETKGSTATPVQQTGCENVPFTPGLNVDAGTTGVDSPAPATVETTLKYLTGAESTVQESHLRKAVVTLPEGMGLNPSGSVDLGECTDAQFKKGQRTYDNECPASSQIGTVEISSPPLERPLTGSIYIGTQKSSNPESGEEFRILVEAKEPKEGIDVRLVGNTAADKTTGQLTTTFDEKEVGELAGALPEGLPQVPFTSVKLKFGTKTVLTSPSICTTEATGQMEPWARPGPAPRSPARSSSRAIRAAAAVRPAWAPASSRRATAPCPTRRLPASTARSTSRSRAPTVSRS